MQTVRIIIMKATQIKAHADSKNNYDESNTN